MIQDQVHIIQICEIKIYILRGSVCFGSQYGNREG